MTRDLTEAIARFDAAQEPFINYTGLDWPAFEHFLAACIAFEKVAEKYIIHKSVEQDLSTLRFARRRLRTLPISPSHQSLGLVEFISRELPIGGEDLLNAVTLCKKAAEALLNDGDHPAVAPLTERVQRLRQSNPDSIIYAVVSRDSVADMTSISDEHDLGLSITDLSGAKKVDTGDACFLFGAPESLHGIGINWMDRNHADRLVAWLFNSPIAREVSVISWTGNRAFKIDRYSIFPGSNLSLRSTSGPEKFNIESIAEIVANTSSSAPVFSTTGLQDADNELVDSRAIQLAGDLWVFYAIASEGPRPDRISESDFQLTVEDVSSLSQLAPGDRLVIRGGDASRKFLDIEADKWLVEKYGKNEPGACKQVRDTFRDGMQTLERTPGAIGKLRTLGLTDHMIQYRFRLSHDRTHIAPESFEDFQKLSEACGQQVTQSDWDHIRHLRSAMKRAGRIARQLMEQKISADDSWMDTVDIPEAANVDMGELGSLVISRILQILPNTVQVPISRLGQIERGKR